MLSKKSCGLQLIGWMVVIAALQTTASIDFRHHNYDSMTKYLHRLAAKCPRIFRLSSIGKSAEGRELWVMRVTDHPTAVEPGEPRFKYVGNMHGNEVVGREILLYLLEHLCAQYGHNKTLTRLVDTTDLRIMPSMNPDGYERASTSGCGEGHGRENANGVDLNRNFPDQFRDHQPRAEPETAAVMRWIRSEPFVLSGNLHGGSVVASYPFDDSAVHARQGVYSGAADDATFRVLAHAYADRHPTMPRGNVCPGDRFPGGVTNGAHWYDVPGGMEDYNYLHSNCFEVTMELSCCKFPPRSQLPREWARNRESLVAFALSAHRGAKGFVRDRLTRHGIPGAVLSVKRVDHDVRAGPFGDYWRLLAPGRYVLTAHAKGYESQSKRVDVPDCEDGGVVVDFSLRPLAAAAAAAVAHEAVAASSARTEQPLVYRHHDHAQMLRVLEGVANRCPHIALLGSLGTSVEGRHLWTLEFAAAPGVHRAGVPEFKYVGNMHGNEVVGREMLLLLAVYLCDNYGTDDRVTRLVNTTRIHLLPTMNPDGYSRSREGDAHSTQGRYNAHHVDLNRNFPDHFHPDAVHGRPQKEMLLLERWIHSLPFVLSANLHNGALVANYPFDDHRNTSKKHYAERSPDDAIFRQVSKAYSFAHPTMHLGRRCPHDHDRFKDGITNGAKWYSVTGGMQDYNYFHSDCFEITIEMGCDKFPVAAALKLHWAQHRPAMLAFIEQVHVGVKGFVADLDGGPIAGALISVEGIEHDVHSHAAGDYYRLLSPGTYTLTASAAEYGSATAKVTVVSATGPPVLLNFTLGDLAAVWRRDADTGSTTTTVAAAGTDASAAEPPPASVGTTAQTHTASSPAASSSSPVAGGGENFSARATPLCTSSAAVASVLGALEARCPSVLHVVPSPPDTIAAAVGRTQSNTIWPLPRLALVAGFDRYSPEALLRLVATLCGAVSAASPTCDPAVGRLLESVHVLVVFPSPQRACGLADGAFGDVLFPWLRAHDVLAAGVVAVSDVFGVRDGDAAFVAKLLGRVTATTTTTTTPATGGRSITDGAVCPPDVRLSAAVANVTVLRVPLLLGGTPCCSGGGAAGCARGCDAAARSNASGSSGGNGTGFPAMAAAMRPAVLRFLASSYSRVQGVVRSESRQSLANVLICAGSSGGNSSDDTVAADASDGICTTSRPDGSYMLLLQPGSNVVTFSAGGGVDAYDGDTFADGSHRVEVPVTDVPSLAQTVYLNVMLSPPLLYGFSKSSFTFAVSLLLLALLAFVTVAFAYWRARRRQRRRRAAFDAVPLSDGRVVGVKFVKRTVAATGVSPPSGRTGKVHFANAGASVPLMVDDESEEEFTMPDVSSPGRAGT